MDYELLQGDALAHATEALARMAYALERIADRPAGSGLPANLERR